MRKILLMLAVSCSLCMGAVTPEFQWGKNLYTNSTAMTSAYGIDVATNGTYFIAAGYQKNTQQLLWGDEAIEFTPSTATVDSSVMLMNVDAEGEMIWKVYSKVGNCRNFAGLAATADGGVVFAGVFRHNTAEYTDEPLVEFVNAKGNSVPVQGPECNNVRQDIGIVVKITAGGEIAWTQTITQSTEYDTQTGITSVMALSALASDDKNNVYIGGKYLSALTLPGGKVLPAGVNRPSSLKTDMTQLTTGDAFIAMLDAETGETLASYCGSQANATAYAASDCVKGLAWSNGVLYFTDLVQGVEGADMNILGTCISPDTFQQPVYGAVETASISDGAFPEAKYVKTIAPVPNSSKKVTLQINGFQADGKNIYISGCLNAGFDLGDLSISSNATALKGFYVKASAVDGAVSSAGMVAESISDMPYVIDDATTGKLYGFGYHLNNGAFMQEFTNGSATLTEDPTYLVTSDKTFGQPQAAFNSATQQVVIGARTNSQPSFYGTTHKGSEGVAVYTAVFAGYKLPGVMSGIEDVTIGDDSSAEVEYYNLQGVKVSTPSNGLYIVRRGSKVTKEIIR